MSYLHPAYYRLLPATARPQLIAFLQLVERNAHASSDGWADVRQAVIATELGRSTRAVKRYELVCHQVGILEVQHGQRNNRRRLRLRSAKEALASNPNPSSKPLREWGHACHHSGDTGVTTVDNLHPLPRARSETRRPSSTLRRPPAAEGSSAPGRGRKLSEPVIKAGTRLAIALGQGANRHAPKLAVLSLELEQLQGGRLTAGYLDLVRDKVQGIVADYPRAVAALRMVQARLRKLRERSGKRFGAHESA